MLISGLESIQIDTDLSRYVDGTKWENHAIPLRGTCGTDNGYVASHND